MTDSDPALPRLLFVVDNDFGALGVVMYLLHGQPLAARATVLLPRRAHELHAAGLAVATLPYESLRDILEVVDNDPPDAVLLFSGYLMARQGLLSIRELRHLVRRLRRRGCAVATSDPSLGTFPRMAEGPVAVRTGAIPRALKRGLGRLPWLHDPLRRVLDLAADRRLRRHVRQVSEILADVPHVYPAAVGALEGTSPRLRFYNPAYIRGDRGALEGGARPQRWLFVLAQYDLHYQEEKYGRERFVDLVAGRLGEALAAGKQPTFIGPAAMVDALSARFPAGSGVTLLGRCAFAEFDRRLFDAEVAFYWQIFSTSAFVRLWNGLPVFSFDAGHTAHFSSALREAGLEHYFMGESPRYLDIERPLDPLAIAASREGFLESARRAAARLAGLPTPRAMADALIDAAPGGRKSARAPPRGRHG